MAEVQDLLIELGTEELPPATLNKLAQSFGKSIEQSLQQAELAFTDIRTYATPRRLAVVVTDLQTAEPDRLLERRGPALQACFDAEGKPTKALQGFARSCGVDVDALITVETDKGAWLVFKQQQAGVATTELIPGIFEQALTALPIAKRMRWGALSGEFVRPVHWLVMLFGDDVVAHETLGVQSGRQTYGHRFHHPQAIHIHSAQSYAAQLESEGQVMVDFVARREAIGEQVQQLASQLGGEAVLNPDLLEEVTGLVEWPVALAGNFDSRFLALPAQALISSMQGHQKYFAIRDAQASLLPHFITICNIESRDPQQVVAGNERVILPRLSDAAFFWETDRKQPLADRQQQLKSIVFHNKLGTVYDKSQRVANLAAEIAQQIGDNKADLARRAGLLAKCDLLTEMVGEFPELQGVMGRYYAQLDGEAEEVAAALDEQYLPRFAGDTLPITATGQALSLAEKLDTLIGLFGIGQPPSGVKDPFALRRAALGVLRILIENRLDLDLFALLQVAKNQYQQQLTETDVVEQVMQYFYDRLRGYAQDQGFKGDVFEAVLAVKPKKPMDFIERLRAVAAFRSLEQAASLAAGNKRIANILRKNAAEGDAPVINKDLLHEPAEQALADQLEQVTATVTPLLLGLNYSAVLSALAEMRETIDRFFEQVMVMSDDDAVRNNRLALLNKIRCLFLGVADISCLRE